MVSAASASRFELELLAPARLSLFLRILRRHDDGFHDSASLFQAVDVGDTLRLARIPGDRSAAAGVVRPSRTAEHVKQNVEFSASPAELPQLPSEMDWEQHTTCSEASGSASSSRSSFSSAGSSIDGSDQQERLPALEKLAAAMYT